MTNRRIRSASGQVNPLQGDDEVDGLEWGHVVVGLVAAGRVGAAGCLFGHRCFLPEEPRGADSLTGAGRGHAVSMAGQMERG